MELGKRLKKTKDLDQTKLPNATDDWISLTPDKLVLPTNPVDNDNDGHKKTNLLDAEDKNSDKLASNVLVRSKDEAIIQVFRALTSKPAIQAAARQLLAEIN